MNNFMWWKEKEHKNKCWCQSQYKFEVVKGICLIVKWSSKGKSIFKYLSHQNYVQNDEHHSYCVKRHIIFAHELKELHIIRVLPPLLPLCSVARSDRHISNWSIKPHVKHLVNKTTQLSSTNCQTTILIIVYITFKNENCIEPLQNALQKFNLISIIFMWHRNTPLKISCYTTLLQSFFKPGMCSLNGILAPPTSHRRTVDILFNFILKQRELKKKVICITELWSASTHLM